MISFTLFTEMKSVTSIVNSVKKKRKKKHKEVEVKFTDINISHLTNKGFQKGKMAIIKEN